MRNGDSLVITLRGRPLAHIIPATDPEREAIARMIARGEAEWNGSTLGPGDPLPAIPGLSLSELIVQERAEREGAISGLAERATAVTAYSDSSALTKRYLAEPESALVLSFMLDQRVVTSTLTWPEMVSAFACAQRAGRIAQDAVTELSARASSEWGALIRVPVSERIAREASGLCRRYDVSGADAVHLATALVWHGESGEPVAFATFDHRQWTAARVCGLIAWPPGLA